jgi:hypothetical protein
MYVNELVEKLESQKRELELKVQNIDDGVIERWIGVIRRMEKVI